MIPITVIHVVYIKNKDKELFEMKRMILAILVSLFGVVSYAAVDDFFADGKYWICEMHNRLTQKDARVKFSVERDTIVNGIDAKVIRGQFLDGESDVKYRYVGYQENNKIYIGFFDKEDSIKVILLLFDFEYTKGDKIPKLYDGLDLFEEYIDVLDDDYIYLDGNRLKILAVQSMWIVRSAYWIENVGSAQGTVYINSIEHSTYAPDEDEDPDLWWDYAGMLECYQDDRLIYSHDVLEEWLEKKNNGLSGVCSVENDAQGDDKPVYDLMGRRVVSAQPGKIYVTRLGKRIFR